MLTSVIAWSLKHRVAVVVSAIVVAIVGILSLRILTIDAFPDSTPVQVQVNTDVPGLVATEVERLVTFPIELQMGGLPGLVEVRSISQFGLSQVTENQICLGVVLPQRVARCEEENDAEYAADDDQQSSIVRGNDSQNHWVEETGDNRNECVAVELVVPIMVLDCAFEGSQVGLQFCEVLGWDT